MYLWRLPTVINLLVECEVDLVVRYSHVVSRRKVHTTTQRVLVPRVGIVSRENWNPDFLTSYTKNNCIFLVFPSVKTF